jgi:hypothetical protein
MGVFDHLDVLDLLGADSSAIAEAVRRLRTARGSVPTAPASSNEAAPTIDGAAAEDAYWRAAVAAARGEVSEADAALDALSNLVSDSPWALKVRARRAFPDLARYEALREPSSSVEEPALVAGALRFLRESQLPDGSWPMGHPAFEVHREGIVVLCALACLLHGERAADARALAWLTERLPGRDAASLNSFTATYWLEYMLARHARKLATNEEVEAAIVLLAGGQLESGAWSYSKSWGEAWRGGFGGWPNTDKGRAHGMNTGNRAGGPYPCA